MQPSVECPNCHSPDLDYAGLQWFPERVFSTLKVKASVQEEGPPPKGALHVYTCQLCQTTFLRPEEKMGRD
jgi:hypothetical protein